MLLSGALLIAGALCPPVALTAATPEYRGFWADAWGSDFSSQSAVDAMLGVPGTSTPGKIREANCNAVVVQVRRRFDVCYPSGVGEPYMSGLSPSTFNSLAAMIRAAHDTTGGKKRVEVHCWSVVFKTSKGQVYSQHIGTPTGSLTTFDNYWPTRINATAGVENDDGAFDAGHPKALEYLINAHMDLVNFQTTAGPGGTDGRIDGIHYDYIRFEAGNEGFNPTSVARYNARHGLTGDPSPSDELFKQWRRDQVSAFVRQMYARIQKVRPSVKQTGAFITWNPSPTSSTRAAFQATRPYYDVYSDWDGWLQEGIVDIAIPMTYYNWLVYPNDYTRWMNFQKDRKANRFAVVGPGLYLNSLDTAILELLMTRDATPSGQYGQGFCGYVLKEPYAGGNWAGFAPRLVSDVTTDWADVPSMPWKTSPTNGHVMGAVTIASNGRWADHTVVSISGGSVNRSLHVDGMGFYAFIDLPPGSYSINAALAGYAPYSTNVTIAVGAMETRDMALQLVGPPGITASPQSKTVYEGAPVSFAANAAGTEPLSFQWRLNSQPISGATTTVYSIAAAITNQAGNYDFVVTNLYGRATSQVALLTVIVPQATERLTELWRLAPGSRPYLTSATDQRGMTYNPVSGRLAIVNKATPAVHILDGDTGADLHTLSTSGVSGGTYSLLMISAADDGALYGCNLATTPSTSPLKIYRWPSDAPSTAPTLAYSGDPIPGNMQRWGDTLDARGSGVGTQIILGSRQGTNAVVFTTANGTTFTPNIVNVNGALNGAFGLGIAFGGGNTFWGKATDHPLTLNSFNMPSESGAVIRTNYLLGTISAIGVSSTFSNLAGVSIETPDNLQLYDMVGNNAYFVGTNAFATDNPNATLTGAVDFAPNKVFALDTGNGLLAMSHTPPPPPPVILTQPQDQTTGLNSSVTFTVAAAGTSLSYQWLFQSAPIPGATAGSYTRSSAQLSHQGAYSVLVGNLYGSITSAPAMLTVIPPPTISQHPQSRTNAQGTAASLDVTPGGEDTSLNYQWLFNGAVISGANQQQYSIASVQPSNAGQYRVVLNNLGGSITSQVAVLTVIDPPQITSSPQSRANAVGTTASFNVSASGTAPFSYQWLFNGAAISGATLSGYSRAGVVNTDAGGYHAIVGNMAGSATSAVAELSVTYPASPSITSILSLGQNVDLQFTGGPGRFVLEASGNLAQWTNQAVLNPATEAFSHQEQISNARLFYRIKRDP